MKSVTTKKHSCSEWIFFDMANHTVRLDKMMVLSTKHHRYRGIALAWTAIVILTVFLLVGLSIDVAKLFYNVHQMQNAADADALAGAQIIKVSTPEETRLFTQALALENKAEHLDVMLRTTAQAEPFEENPELDIILGRWVHHLRFFFPTLDTPDAVKVIARRTDGLEDAPALAMLFGPLVGVNTANARRESIGWYNEVSGAGLIILNERPVDKSDKIMPGLLIADNVGDVRVIGGSIHVNTVYEGVKSEAAVYVKGGGRMQCARLTVTGHTDPVPDSSDWATISRDDYGNPVWFGIMEGAPYLPDPLRDIPPPLIPNDAEGNYIWKSFDEKTTTMPCTLEPGYYPGGIEITSTGSNVTLNPGTYIIGGGNRNKDSGLIQTGGTLTGYGVLIYLTKDYVNTDGRWAQLDVGGNVVTDITPPGDEMEHPIKDGLEGISIWQDRANTKNVASLHGGSGMMISGTLYFPNNHVYLAGNPGKAGNQILCGSLEVHGKAKILVEYDGRNSGYRGSSILVK